MIYKKLVDAGFAVVLTQRWKRRAELLAPATVTSIRQKVANNVVVADAAVGAWVRASGKVWLLNPLLDPFVIVVEAPARGRASSEAEIATLALAKAISEETSATLDGKATIPLSEKTVFVDDADTLEEVENSEESMEE